MPLVIRVDERDERAGIHDDMVNHVPYPSRCFGFVDRSPGPFAQPMRSPASSSADAGRSPFKKCSNAARMTSDLLWRRCFAALSSFTLNAAGSFNDSPFMAHLGNTRRHAIVIPERWLGQ